MKLDRNVLLYGSPEPLPEAVELRAGPLSLLYEAGDLRYVRFGEHEILRRLYVAVRDRNWGTVPAVLSNVRMETGPDSFRIEYDADHRQGDIHFSWHAVIEGRPDEAGTGAVVRFEMDGEARSAFLTNRTGFCVLHPGEECAGRPCELLHPDSATEASQFPRLISAHQPFMELRAITHEVSPGVQARVLMEGDIFETEDQRNWTDASFKTYCTPLRLPYPVEVQPGTRIRQSITLVVSAHTPTPTHPHTHTSPVVLTLDPAPTGRRFPGMGLGIASHGAPLAPREVQRLRALGLTHLRVDLTLSDPAYPQALARAAEQSEQLGLIPLEVALTLSDRAEEELNALVALLRETHPPVGSWLVFHARDKSTSERWVHLARQWLLAYEPLIRFGAGTNAYFTELNRGRPPVEVLNYVAYSINPQVHAFDNRSLVETLAAQAQTVESARAFCGAVPIAVTPVTLKPRFNPDATGTADGPAAGELPPEVDPRQMSLFGAAWTLGSLKYLAESGAEQVTYYETTGWRGVMETEAGSPLPDRFPSLPGAVFPLYHVLADAGEFVLADVLRVRSERPLQVDALALRRGGRTCVLVANMTAEPQVLRLRGAPGRVRARVLDETNAEEVTTAPERFRQQAGEEIEVQTSAMELPLRPYAIARLDWQRSLG